MLDIKRSAGVAPEVNLKEHVTCTPQASANKAAYYGSENPEEMSPEVKNCGINGPTKRAYVLQKLFKKGKEKEICSSLHHS